MPHSPRAILSTLPAPALLLLLGLPAAAQEPAEPPQFQRPRTQVLRQNEDWSGLRGLERSTTGDFLDPLKFVPLKEDGSWWMSVGGQARARFEGWRDFNFGQAPAGTTTDDEFVLWRLMLHTDFHFGENLRLFAEGKSALSSDRELAGGKRALDEDQLDLQQLFADLSVGSADSGRFTLRPGRFMLLLGRERLVSPLAWSNTMRTWDGVQAMYRSGSWNLNGFWSRYVPVDATSFNEPDLGNDFYGLYATHAAGKGAPTLDLYWLGYSQEGASFNGTSGTDQRDTFGWRLGGRFGESAYDYDLESAYQIGEVGDEDVSAWMIATQVGRTLEGATKPRVWLGFDYASGDDEAGGDVGTFNQLYPLGHAYLGYIDAIGRQNILAGSFGFSVAPDDALTLAWDNHAFWLADTEDALYNAGGAVSRPGGSASSSYVGFEVDLTAQRRFDRHLVGLLGYSHFFAGDMLSESGAGEDTDFVYLSLQYNF